MQSPIGQIDGLQVLRAIAVFLVVWGHASWGLTPANQLSRLPDLGIFGIDIFFALSGFILATVVLRTHRAAGPATAWNFFLRRIIRIYPAYWIVAIVMFVQLIRHHRELSLLYLSGFFLLPLPDYPVYHLFVAFSWTLVFEMFFYSLLALTLLFTVNYAVPILMGVLTVCVALGRLGSIHKPFIIIAANPILLEFVYGAAIALVFQAWGTRRTLGRALVLVGASAAVILRACNTPTAGPANILFGGGALLRSVTWGVAGLAIVAGVVFWSPSCKSTLARFAIIMGNASYSTYLISGFLIPNICSVMWPHVGLHPPLPRLLLFVWTDVLIVFTTGWLFYQFIEWPMLRRLQTLIKTR